MAHRSSLSAYHRLSDRLNRFPQGAPPTDLLFRILKLLFRENEAELVSVLPIKPFSAKKATRIWKTSEAKALRVLEELANRALAAAFGVILRLPTVKRALAAEQVQSRYLDKLVSKFS